MSLLWIFDYEENMKDRVNVIVNNEDYKIKRIEVNPKSRLSYQYHMISYDSILCTLK